MVHQQKLQKLTKILLNSLILKRYNFHSKQEIYTKSKKEKRIPSALVLLDMKTRKNIQIMYNKNVAKKIMLIYGYFEMKKKIHYVLIKYFNTFMYNHNLHCSKKRFCHYCLQALSTQEILKRYIKDCFKINGKQKIIMLKKNMRIC